MKLTFLLPAVLMADLTGFNKISNSITNHVNHRIENNPEGNPQLKIKYILNMLKHNRKLPQNLRIMAAKRAKRNLRLERFNQNHLKH